MSERNNNIDKVFREKLGNYREFPPSDSWANIKNGISKKSERKIIIPVWRIAAGIAILITAGYLLHSLRKQEIPVISEKRDVYIEQTEKTLSAAKDLKKDELPAKVAQSEERLFQDMSPKDKSADKSFSSEKKSDIKSLQNIPSQGKSASYHDLAKTETGSSQVGSVLPAKSLEEQISSITETSEREDDIFVSDIPYRLTPGKVIPDRIPDRTHLQGMNLSINEIPLKTNEGSVVKKDFWSITAQVSPVYSYRNIDNTDQATITSLNKAESGIISYGGGLQLGYRASERISLYGGIMYSRLGVEVSNIVTYGVSDQTSFYSESMVSQGTRAYTYALNNSTGFISSDQLNAVVINPKSSNISTGNSQEMKPEVVAFNLSADNKIDQYFDFLEIPFLLRYKLLEGKFCMNLIGGVSTNILIGNSVYLITEDERTRIGQTENIHNLNYSGNVGIGFDYDLGKNFLFTLEPQFRYYLNSINKDNLVSNRPYSIGMYTGIRYIF